MKRVLFYVLVGLAIVAGFCVVFSIVLVLIAVDTEAGKQLTEKWMPYISLMLVIAIPALLVWSVFRFGRNMFFKKIRKKE